MAWPKGSFCATNMPLRLLIADAYDIRQFQRFMLVGGPEELLAERYDIQARSPEPAPEGQHFAMLRSLLVDRFRLRVHRETRQIPTYAVTIAREGALGPDLRSSPHDCAAFAAAGGRRTDENAPTGADGQAVCFVGDSFRAGLLTKQNAGPLTQLLARVQGFVDRPLSDATGLTGSYQWRLEFSASGPTADSPHPSIYTAFREQLGLKLEPRTGPVDMLVIDSVERPRPD
jgi:uncharacterized protein (TIGR03435 family)